MSFRRVSSSTTTSYPYSNTAASPPISASPLISHDQSTTSSAQQTPSPTMRKRQRTLDMHQPSSTSTDAHPPPPSSAGPPPVGDDAFINDHDAADSAGDDDDDEEKPKSDKKAGRRKIKIEFIQDKSRRHITFSKRKAGMSRLLFFPPQPVLSLPFSQYLFSGIMKKVTFFPFIFDITSHTHARHMNCLPLLALRSSFSSYPRQVWYTLSPLQSYNPSSPNQKARTLYKLVSMLLMVLSLHPCLSAPLSAVLATP